MHVIHMHTHAMQNTQARRACMHRMRAPLCASGHGYWYCVACAECARQYSVVWERRSGCVGEAVGLCGRGGGVLWKRRSGCVGEAVGCCVRQVARPRASLPPTSSRTWLHPLLYTDQTLESSRAQLSRDSSTKPHPATAQPHLTQSSPTAQHSAQARLGKSGIAGMSKPQAYRHKSLDHVRDHRHQNLTDT